ncbi:hypothetical protein A2988_00260 [Candidatus Azambacteria bacterium RIFCSPLOWO2_01_FULL_46_25]|uniref:EamA domain-containing protein n=1 Tax=Candidatus Azambacteria bacterium RIFCSPLOWO2_01_FULL_46_25 TaxID=1797298 RepID=A0A1F5BTG5_9BACT|nr:MAG: hypothetical protein A2988_00260 [Candidatus Azambacteria bacterium RIFCSPLOWO2_01_FULL_46_25]OGD37142.1 MAG: hypothetical protein A2850_04190 [Candidatus Azambacteria bacterium RIFCSPHIGHO2_01_FULL_51_74]
MINTSLNLKGVKFALAAAAVSGFAVFLNSFGVKLWQSSSGYTTAKNIVAALFLAALLVVLHKLPELKRHTGKTWGKLALIGFIGGSVPFLLFFKSLTLMSPVEAAFIHKTLFIWVALLAYPFLKERIGAIQFLAFGILLGGVFMLGAPPAGGSNWTFGAGFWLALCATVLWAIENIIAKIILKEVSASVVGAARMGFGALFLLLYLASTGSVSALFHSTLAQAGWALATGVVLFGYVALWYRALALAPASVVASVLVIAAPITSLLQALFITHTLAWSALGAALLIVLGIAVFLYGFIRSLRSARSYDNTPDNASAH